MSEAVNTPSSLDTKRELAKGFVQSEPFYITRDEAVVATTEFIKPPTLDPSRVGFETLLADNVRLDQVGTHYPGLLQLRAPSIFVYRSKYFQFDNLPENGKKLEADKARMNFRTDHTIDPQTREELISLGVYDKLVKDGAIVEGTHGPGSSSIHPFYDHWFLGHYLKGVLEVVKQNGQPDLENISKSMNLRSIPHFRRYVAYKLANPDSGPGAPKITTLEELMDILGRNYLNIKPGVIRVELEGMATREQVSELIQEGHITDADLDTYFSNIASWNTMLSLKSLHSGRGVQAVFPFAITRNQNRHKDGQFTESDDVPIDYDVRYLPYLVSAVETYIRNVPVLLKPGHMFPLSDVVTKLSQLRTLCQETIIAQKDDFDKDTIRDIVTRVNQGLSSLSDTYTEVVATGSWNRRRESGSPTTLVQSLKGLREAIRESGGRAPRHLDIKRKHAIRKGQDF